MALDNAFNRLKREIGIKRCIIIDGNVGDVYLNEKGRKTVINGWRARKQEQIAHPFLKEKIPIGLIPYTQAMLFARVLRGDLDCYPPFVWR